MRHLLFISLFFFQITNSQVPVGHWQEYLSFSNVHSVDKIDNIVYAATSVGLFSYDSNEHIISKYTKINLLSDIDISTIKSIPNTKKLFIGYANGNIDILENGEVENIPDLKIKSMTNSKRINHVDFINNKAFCATDFGILVVDYNKLEIADFFYIGDQASMVKVSQIAHTTDSMFAATETGLRKASINSSALSFYETWEYTSDDKTQFYAVVSNNNKIITTKKSNNKYVTYHYSDSEWNPISSSSNFVGLQNNNNTFSVIHNNKIEIYYSNLILEETISNYIIDDNDLALNCTSILIDESGEKWIGDSKNGLIKINETNNLQILPDGPYTNICTKILATQTSVYCINGLPHQPVPVNTPASLSVFSSEGWTNINKETEPGFTFQQTIKNGEKEVTYTLSAINLSDILVDPTNNERIYISSARHGIFEFTNNKITNHFYINNSQLQQVFNDSTSTWVLVNGFTMDNDGNLFTCNQEVKYPVVVKPFNVAADSASWISYDYFPYENPDEQTWLQKMIYTSWGHIWAVAFADPNGLFVMDTNGTPYDTRDDRYRGPKNQRNVTFSDPLRYSDIAIWNDEGQSVGAKLICLTEDKSGYIWIGTERGLLVYYRPRNIFEEERPQASRILVPRNDGSGLADYLLENENITVIEVDGANRKWIGTQNGVFLISADGTETIHHFTTSNSSLISNIINSISINPETGEVFIATNKGIVSYMGTATEGKTTYNEAKAFPNPVYPNYNGFITVTGLIENSTIKITDISGKLVFESISDGGQIVWNGRNLNNKKVSSGVYLVFATNQDGEKSLVTKIMIVR